MEKALRAIQVALFSCSVRISTHVKTGLFGSTRRKASGFTPDLLLGSEVLRLSLR